MLKIYNFKVKIVYIIIMCYLFNFDLNAQKNSNVQSIWNITELKESPEFTLVSSDSLVSSLIYSSVNYNGLPTEVFAYYSNPDMIHGLPPSGRKFPAIVLVHGGGGKAFKEWVTIWAKAGYAAIAMDLDGKDDNLNPLRYGGPNQSIENKILNFSSDNLQKAWTYHAVTSVIKGHSLILSFDEVDKDKTGITGISWGGYLTCLVAGIDNRFKAAVPIYGCGYLYQTDIFKHSFKTLGVNDLRAWIKYYDPSNYMDKIKIPILFINGNKDKHFNVISYHKTYSLVPEKFRFVCIKPDMRHSHPAGWESREIKLFFDNIFYKRKELPIVDSVYIKGEKIIVNYNSKYKVLQSSIYYSKDTISPNIERVWYKNSAFIDSRNQSVVAELPNMEWKYLFIQLIDRNGTSASTEFIFKR